MSSPSRNIRAALALLAVAGCDRERDRLIADLENPRPELRASALARLSAMEREEDLPHVLRRTSDTSAMVRRTAAEALGRTTDLRAIDVLGDLLGDSDDDVQAAAAASLARFKSDKARAYLLTAYGRRGPQTRAAIVRALGSKAAADAVRYEADHLWERNLKVLEQGSHAERVGAAEELGRSGRPEAVDRLMPLLGSDLVLLAASAARGLGAAADRRAVGPLANLLKESHSMLREAAAEALGALGDLQAIAPLEKAALEGGPAAAAAVVALGRLPAESPDVKRALCQVATASATPEIAARAARLARPRGGCSATPIANRLAAGGADARSALAALGALGPGTPGSDRIAALLEAGDSATRIPAARALAERDAATDPSVRAALARVVKTEGERVGALRGKWIRVALPESFAEGYGPAEAPPESLDEHGHDGKGLKDLLQMVKDADASRAKRMGVTVRDRVDAAPEELADDLGPDDTSLLAAALRALSRAKTPEVAGVLAGYARDPDESVRASALAGLALSGDAASVPVAREGLDDPSAEVVAAVAQAFAKSGAAGAGELVAALTRRRAGRAEIARALGGSLLDFARGGRSNEAAAALSTLLAAGGEEAVEAAIALGKSAAAPAAAALVAHLKDSRAVGRLEAIEALGEIASPAATDVLVGELFHDRPEIRAAAVRVLMKVNAGALSPHLEALRQDYYGAVRRVADQAAAKGEGAH